MLNLNYNLSSKLKGDSCRDKKMSLNSDKKGRNGVLRNGAEKEKLLKTIKGITLSRFLALPTSDV